MGSVVSVAGASTVHCMAVLSASQCARGWLVWWVECLKRSPSASGIALHVSGVFACTLVAVPFPSHRATHEVWLWHIKVTVGVSGVWSRTVQSVTFRPITGTRCSAGPVSDLSCSSWSISSPLRVSLFS